MDPFLSEYFGTNQEAPEQVTETDDLEKMAQLVMLDKIAANQGVDLSTLTDEQYVELAQEVFENDGQEKVAADQDVEQPEQLTEQEKVAAAKFEESVYLGKVAAHALWNELNSIQQVAMEKEAKKGVFERIGQTFGGGKKAREVAKNKAKNYAEGGQSRASRVAAEDAADEASAAASSAGKKIVGGTAAAAGLTAAGVGGKALHSKMTKKDDDGQSKEGSAFNALSDARAYEILQEYGLADGEGNVVTPDQLQKHAEQQEETTAADRLAVAVEQEAWEKLASLGYPVIDQQQE